MTINELEENMFNELEAFRKILDTFEDNYETMSKENIYQLIKSSWYALSGVQEQIIKYLRENER